VLVGCVPIIGLVAEHSFRRLDPADQAFCDRAVVRFRAAGI
jgi:hypothetical protein